MGSGIVAWCSMIILMSILESDSAGPDGTSIITIVLSVVMMFIVMALGTVLISAFISAQRISDIVEDKQRTPDSIKTLVTLITNITEDDQQSHICLGVQHVAPQEQHAYTVIINP
jgi:hypothetical protein